MCSVFLGQLGLAVSQICFRKPMLVNCGVSWDNIWIEGWAWWWCVFAAFFQAAVSCASSWRMHCVSSGQVLEPCSAEDVKVGEIQRILADQLELLDKVEQSAAVMHEAGSAAD